MPLSRSCCRNLSLTRYIKRSKREQSSTPPSLEGLGNRTFVRSLPRLDFIDVGFLASFLSFFVCSLVCLPVCFSLRDSRDRIYAHRRDPWPYCAETIVGLSASTTTQCRKGGEETAADCALQNDARGNAEIRGAPFIRSPPAQSVRQYRALLKKSNGT